MQPRIELIPERTLIGMKQSMSFADNKTASLWQGFMPRRKEVQALARPELYSMQVYPPGFSFAQFNPTLEFQKWAAVEVQNTDHIPAGMECFTLPSGLYAIFHYKGLNTNTEIFRYIFGTWLPASGYEMDTRPHFELLGAQYKNNDPDSEEDIYVPIK